MKIYSINQKVAQDRKPGKSLFDQGLDEYIFIYRACHNSINTFKENDYVTRYIKFAKEHSDHQTAVNEEVYHVIYAMVSSKFVKDAYNPGEYFWAGKETKGRVMYTSKVDI